MRTEQRTWTSRDGWDLTNDNDLSGKAQLVIAFGSRDAFADPARMSELKEFYPGAQIVSATTSGEIIDTMVWDESIIATAVWLEHSSIKLAQLKAVQADKSYEAGKKLMEQLDKNKLAHVFVLSDGLKVNGSELVKGFNENLPPHVTVTGGLAGDGARFEKTMVGVNGDMTEGNLVAVGFYGDRLKVGYGSVGGWDPFGPSRMVTRSAGNVLYELDGQPALELYKKYLGEQAQGLPGTGLLFPLSIKTSDNSEPLVRTILAVDEKEQSLTFAGDIPMNAKANLMKANFERIIEGASSAAGKSSNGLGGGAELAILISCVGRKLILSQRIEEEVESVRDILGDSTTITGFYSYGEISPFTPNAKCELHNQTMTVTTLSEA
jgi:hypothetical protein